MFENAKWIWKSTEIQKDEYVVFSFDLNYVGGEALMRLSADSDYNLLINGKLVSFGQYHDYEENAVYEEILLQDYLKTGKNRVEILVWYYGEPNFSYSLGKAGLLFEVMIDGAQVARSDEHILSAYEPHYTRGYCKNITWQLGYSYEYDANKPEPVFSCSVVVEKAYPVAERPVKRVLLGDGISGKLTKQDGLQKYVFDFDKETVGFLNFCVDCQEKSRLTFSYGEHLINGDVRHEIDGREFSFIYHAKQGKNTFYNAFRRLGCRYIMVESDKPFSVGKVQLLSTDYPFTDIPFDAGNPLRQAIYDTAIRTLKMCAHDHYEDCPWREQGLYVMDSRNQMLCGYYAFAEYEYAKASLALFINARRCGGLLPICAPCDYGVTIPSFSLHYFGQVREYLQYSNDAAFVASIYDKLVDLLRVFDARVENGLLLEFIGDEYWNFYEWEEGLSDKGKNKYHLILNALYLQALQNMSIIAKALHKEDVFMERAERLKNEISRYFYDKSLGVFVLGKEDPAVTELGNYLCVSTGVVAGEQAENLIQTLRKNKDRVTLSLSMRCFEYDALLAVDKQRYAEEILADIDERWKKMLDAGATTFWETEKGYKDFNGAGSLCHGWSAVPVYYYHILLGH